ncbi:SipW-dependent-type signal peptide-containing protein (plasmid) [Curtobacterium sp. TC1]|nr:SipW-dependent-type signal peptide-containing protein [Curtobacterium sp. TC1]
MRATPRRPQRWPVLRSVLAFGLVAGVSVPGTIAQWTDQEYGTGTFTAGSFAMQSSTDGTTFADHPSGSAAPLTFNAAAMYPGLTVAAPLVVRTTAGSLGGTVSLSSATTSGNATLVSTLAYKVYADTVSGCTTTSTPSSSGTWVAGSTTTFVSGLTTAVPSNTRPLPAATSGAPGAAVYYCLIVQLPATAPNTVQGVTATATWSLTGSPPSA